MPLFKPKKSLWQRLKDVALLDVGVLARGGIDAESIAQLETLLLEADFGVPVAMRLIGDIERQAKRGAVKTEAEFLGALRDGIAGALTAGNSDPGLRAASREASGGARARRERRGQDDVHRQARARGSATRARRVLVAAGDTFRAGAIDQLRVWAERSGSGVRRRRSRAAIRPPSRSTRSTRRSRAAWTW